MQIEREMRESLVSKGRASGVHLSHILDRLVPATP